MNLKSVKAVAAAAALMAWGASAFAQTVSTDKADYEPAETVIVSGAGFAASEAVSITADGDTNGSHIAATLTSGADGSLSGSLTLPAVYEKTYTLVAAGATGDRAQITFLDSPGSIDRTTPGQASVTLACGQTQTFVARVRTNTNVSVSGLAVNWTAEAGSVSPTAPASNASGEVSAVHTAAATPSTYKVKVAASDGNPFVHWVVTTVCQTSTPPTLTCPADLALDTEPGLCGAVANFSATVGGSPAPTLSYSQQPGTLFSRGLTPVTVTATNEAGTASCSFNVTVKDVSAPQITAPANGAYECSGQVPPASPLDATATDNCSANVTVTETDNGGIGNAANPKVITRTYTATDPEGNTASAAQTITVIDALPPVFSPAAAAAFQCSQDVPAGSAFDAPATDNCGAPTVSYVGQTDNGGLGSPASPLVITRTYKAVDAVGNESETARQTTVIDNIAPSITIAAVSGNACLNIGQPVLSDNCGGPVTAENNAPQWFPLGGTSVLWTATDNHGNSATADQAVAVTGYGEVSAYGSPVGASARPGQVKKGSSLPVKFSLLECPAYPLATATISVDPAKATSTSYPHQSNAFRYSAGGRQYIYNLDMNSSYTVGSTYNIMSLLGDGQVITGAVTVSK